MAFNFNPDELRDASGRWTTSGAKRAIHDAIHASEDKERHSFSGGKLETGHRLSATGRRILGGYRETQFRHRNSTGTGYTAARERMHDAIIEHFLAGHKSQDQPVALFTAGGAASGKSAVRDKEAPKDAVLIDPDEIKRMIPEYQGLDAAGHGDMAASAVHEESSDIAKRLTNEAMKRHLNVIVDGVGDSARGKFVGKIKGAQRAGYHVQVAYAHAPVEVAIKRAAERAKRTGRHVNTPTLVEGHAHSTQNFADVAKIPGIGIKVYDNSGKRPRLIAAGNGNSRGHRGMRLHDTNAFEGFLSKARVNPDDYKE